MPFELRWTHDSRYFQALVVGMVYFPCWIWLENKHSAALSDICLISFMRRHGFWVENMKHVIRILCSIRFWSEVILLHSSNDLGGCSIAGCSLAFMPAYIDMIQCSILILVLVSIIMPVLLVNCSQYYSSSNLYKNNSIGVLFLVFTF